MIQTLIATRTDSIVLDPLEFMIVFFDSPFVFYTIVFTGLFSLFAILLVILEQYQDCKKVFRYGLSSDIFDFVFGVIGLIFLFLIDWFFIYNYVFYQGNSVW